jgi:ketosteroid isomerase-like protein
MDMSRNIDVVKGIYTAFGQGNVPAVLGALDSQVEWREAEGIVYADGNPYSGPQAVAERVFQRIITDIENFSVNPERFIDGGDTVVVEGRYRGKMKATGTPLNAQFAHVMQLRDGRVVRFQQYTDTRQWEETAGR